MTETLSRDEIINLETYMVPCGFLPIYFEDYGQNSRTKVQVSALLKFYSWCITCFSFLIIVRSIFVTYYDDPYIHWILGYSYLTHPYLNWLIIFEATYTFIIYRINWSSARNNVMALDWIEVFQLLQGFKPPAELGTNIKIAEVLSRYARRKMANCLYIIGIRMTLASAVFVSIYTDEDSILRASDEHYDYYSMGWLIIMTIWAFINTVSMYLTVTVFDILAFYFRIRFHKVNRDIETIIFSKESKSINIKPIELMRQVLIEHDFLCWKLEKYNRYWCLIVLASFALHPLVFTYCMYEIYFMPLSWLALIILWGLTFESAYLFFRMFVAGVGLNDEVHHVYLRAVRASLAAKYPIDMRLQVRLFVQRISGPPIGFHCYNLFGLSRHNLYHACVHLGQNFFLVIDFVVSQKQARILIAEARAAKAVAMANAMIVN